MQIAKFNFFTMMLIKVHVFSDVSLYRRYIVTYLRRFICCESGIRSITSRLITVFERSHPLAYILSQKDQVPYLTFYRLIRYYILPMKGPAFMVTSFFFIFDQSFLGINLF